MKRNEFASVAVSALTLGLMTSGVAFAQDANPPVPETPKPASDSSPARPLPAQGSTPMDAAKPMNGAMDKGMWSKSADGELMVRPIITLDQAPLAAIDSDLKLTDQQKGDLQAAHYSKDAADKILTPSQKKKLPSILGAITALENSGISSELYPYLQLTGIQRDKLSDLANGKYIGEQAMRMARMSAEPEIHGAYQASGERLDGTGLLTESNNWSNRQGATVVENFMMKFKVDRKQMPLDADKTAKMAAKNVSMTSPGGAMMGNDGNMSMEPLSDRIDRQNRESLFRRKAFALLSTEQLRLLSLPETYEAYPSVMGRMAMANGSDSAL